MAERFYTNSALAVGPVLLQGPEAHHLATVCRFSAGERVILFNGDGREYSAEIVSVNKKQVELMVQSVEQPLRELGFHLEVAAPLPKGDRADFLIEKLTELGVTDFVPLRTQRSVVQPRETKLERLQRTVIEASKQCGRNVLMQVHALAEWSEYCARKELPVRKLLAHPETNVRMIASGPGADVCVAVGPEGGFTQEEVELAKAAGWRLVSLGPKTLRVETAALVLAACVSSLETKSG
jgi:16S rRNA (uracil1498-N3)-methyltransferase